MTCPLCGTAAQGGKLLRRMRLQLCEEYVRGEIEAASGVVALL
jgi:hypothetical protein